MFGWMRNYLLHRCKRLDWKKAEEVEHGLSAEYDLITIFNWAQHEMRRAFLSSGKKISPSIGWRHYPGLGFSLVTVEQSAIGNRNCFHCCRQEPDIFRSPQSVQCLRIHSMHTHPTKSWTCQTKKKYERRSI